MEERKAYDKVLGLLDDNCLSLDLIKEYGPQAPVNPLFLSNVNKEHVISISEELLEDLYNIHTYTKKTGIEIPFFLFGKERADGSVLFDEIVIGKGNSTQQADASSIANELEKFIQHVESRAITNTIVCHGHTHGRGQFADNFSLHDMAVYIMMRDIHPLFKNKTIDTIGCVFNSSGDINFVLYDEYNEGFYKFPDVNIEFENGTKERLPSYKRGKYNTSNQR